MSESIRNLNQVKTVAWHSNQLKHLLSGTGYLLVEHAGLCHFHLLLVSSMNPSERHFDSHTFFLLVLSAQARGRDSGKEACERIGGGCQLMQVTRVLKFIVSCSQAAKIYTMNTLARQAHSQGASWSGKLAHQLKWKLSPDDSAHKWTRLYG